LSFAQYTNERLDFTSQDENSKKAKTINEKEKIKNR